MILTPRGFPCDRRRLWPTKEYVDDALERYKTGSIGYNEMQHIIQALRFMLEDMIPNNSAADADFLRSCGIEPIG